MTTTATRYRHLRGVGARPRPNTCRSCHRREPATRLDRRAAGRGGRRHQPRQVVRPRAHALVGRTAPSGGRRAAPSEAEPTCRRRRAAAAELLGAGGVAQTVATAWRAPSATPPAARPPTTWAASRRWRARRVAAVTRSLPATAQSRLSSVRASEASEDSETPARHPSLQPTLPARRSESGDAAARSPRRKRRQLTSGSHSLIPGEQKRASGGRPSAESLRARSSSTLSGPCCVLLASANHSLGSSSSTDGGARTTSGSPPPVAAHRAPHGVGISAAVAAGPPLRLRARR